jgi:hypothetical protein
MWTYRSTIRIEECPRIAAKVAKRLHILILGNTDYVATQGRWRKHIEWIRVVYVSAFQARTKRLLPYRRKAVRKICITNWVQWVQRELSLQALAPIPEKEIKKEVQKASGAFGPACELLGQPARTVQMLI